MTYTPPTSATALGTLTVTQWNTQVKGNIEHVVNQPVGTAISDSATAGSVYTLGTSDVGKLLMCAGTASGTVQIPLNSSQAFAIGQKVDLAQLGTGTVTVVGTAGVDLRSTPSAILRTQYSAASVVKINTDEWLLIGDLF